MDEEIAEKRIKLLQRRMLSFVEEHPTLSSLHPTPFNKIRKKVFRATFEAYRLGRVGIPDDVDLFEHFIGWLTDYSPLVQDQVREEIRNRCFGVTLEAFRIGALVAGHDI